MRGGGEIENVINLFTEDNLFQYKLEGNELVKRDENDLNEERNFILQKQVFLEPVNKGEYNILKNKLKNIGLLESACTSTSIREDFTFDDLIYKSEVTFFTNWIDAIHFPRPIGSGVLLPGADARFKTILYTTTGFLFNKHLFQTFVCHVFIPEDGQLDEAGKPLEMFYKWSTLTTNQSTSNPNLVINPNFRINQRDGHVVKEGAKVYYDTSFTQVANESIPHPYEVTGIFGNYATLETLYTPTKITLYARLEDITEGYVRYIVNDYSSKIYTFDRWFLRGFASLEKKEDGIIFKKLKLPDEGYALLGTIIDGSDEMEGEELTVTLCVNGDIRSATIPEGWTYEGTEKVLAYLPGFVDFHGTISCLTTSNNYLEIRVYLANGLPQYDQCKVQWAKLERGSVATKFIPPQKSSELIKCKYFYQELITNKAIDFIDPNFLVINLQFEEMRVIPTAKFKNNKFNEGNYTKVQGNTLADDIFEFELQPVNFNSNIIHVKAKKTNHGLNFIDTLIIVTKLNPVCLDAEYK